MQEGGFALDVRCASGVKRLTVLHDDGYYLQETRPFESMESLLEHYTNSPPTLKSGWTLLLRKPLRLPPFPQAVDHSPVGSTIFEQGLNLKM